MMGALFALLLSAGQPDANALFSLYAEGRYGEAMREGEASGTAEGFAIAARAALAEAMMAAKPCLSCLQRGEDDARRAIAADPKLPDGHVWLAASLGYQARIRGIVWAKIEGDPDQAKAQLDNALSLDPDNAYALAALGGWNAEIVRVGGRYLAREIYDASMEQGFKLFDHAEVAAPKNVAVHYQIALALAAFDANAYRPRVESELEQAAMDPPQTAYEKFIAARARELLALLKRGDNDAFETKLRAFQGYP